MKIQTTDVFTGETVEHTVEITTDHPASSYNQPVIVFDDGQCCNAETWLLCNGRLIEATADEKTLFEKWERLIKLFAGVPC